MIGNRGLMFRVLGLRFCDSTLFNPRLRVVRPCLVLYVGRMPFCSSHQFVQSRVSTARMCINACKIHGGSSGRVFVEARGFRFYSLAVTVAVIPNRQNHVKHPLPSSLSIATSVDGGNLALLLRNVM